MKKKKYTRFAVISIEEVMPLLNDSNYQGIIVDHKKKTVIHGKRAIVKGFNVKVNSLRLVTFKTKGIVCSSCKMKAAFFAIEQGTYEKVKHPHLNLYGINENGDEVLFTHDHVIPLSKGGPNTLENSVPMCIKCNQKKGDKVDAKN